MRKKIVAGNWKMNRTFQDAEELLFAITELLADKPADDVQVIVCPPSVFLELGVDIAGEGEFAVGAQNINENDKGAFTGEISASMLRSMQVEYCIIGHSERRKYFNESNELLAKKIDATLQNEIIPIYCCGEILSERENNKHFEIVQNQLTESLFHLSVEEFSKVVIAYEPVWAIGTGITASPEQAQEMHAFIRNFIKGQFGDEIANNTSILYGGSCNAKNAHSLFINEDVDGGLIGGASLSAEDFVEIVNSY